jgi:hypothetical protein
VLAAREAHDEALARATQILCQEGAAERISAWGRPGVWSSRRFIIGIHEFIPSAFFANPRNTILPDGWATCGWDATVQHWADWNGPDWGDVLFKREEVFALMARLAAVANAAESRAAQRPSLVPERRPRLAIPNKPGGGGTKMAAAVDAMVLAVREGKITFASLRHMKQKELGGLYPAAGRTLLTEAREEALAFLIEEGYGEKAAT